MTRHLDPKHALPTITPDEIQKACRRGGKWVVVDNTVCDVAELVDGEDAAHKGGNVFNIGRDNTYLFRELHANMPALPSRHRPDLPSITHHILEKVQKIAIGILAGHEHEIPLTDPRHKFWTPSERKPPMIAEVTSSLRAQGQDAAAMIAEAVAQFRPDSPEYRAFWAVVGSLVADAAAQPTHWNYKVTYYHSTLKEMGAWDQPEFLTPSINAYYRVPVGSHSCFGDQAAVVLRSLVQSGGAVDVNDLTQKHVAKFGPQSDYGKMGRHDAASAGDLPIDGPWRHGSIATFLRNVQKGVPYPACGSNDGSSDCFVKTVPVVALYAGRPELLQKVTEVVKLTQNNAYAVAFACAAARILEHIILTGECGSEAVSVAVADLVKASRQSTGPGGRRGSDGSLDQQIAQEIMKTMELQHFPYLEGVLAYSGGKYNAVKVS